MKLTSVVMLCIGVVLVFGAVKNRDPRDIVREALRKPPNYTGNTNDYLPQPGRGTAPIDTAPKPPVVSV